MSKKIDRLSAGLSGVAGEFFVAAELSRRGYIASLTQRNTKGIDVLASSPDGERQVSIQVKTNQSGYAWWVLSEKAEVTEGDTLFYVFVNLNGMGFPTFHVVPSSVVSQFCKQYHVDYLAGSSRKGTRRKDTRMRAFKDLEMAYLGRWDLLKLD